MTLGIQKLQGGVPFDVALPNFNSAGIRKPANRMGYVLTPRWPTDAGTLSEGPLQNSSGPVGNGSWTRGGFPFVISFWIRIPAGGGGNIITLYNPGHLVGLGSNHNDSFSINVTETTITMTDQLNNVENIGFENTGQIDFTRSYDINQQNAGWHHVFITMNRTTSSDLYVDGRNIGWDSITTSGQNLQDNVGKGYGAIGIGGTRTQVQQGVTTVVNYADLANQYDICHLGIWQGGGIGGNTNDFYPRFFDPGTSGKMDGSWTAPTGSQEVTAFPYPMIWCEFDYSNSGAQPIVGTAFGARTTTFNVNNESQVFDESSTISWEEGVSGAGAISAAP